MPVLLIGGVDLIALIVALAAVLILFAAYVVFMPLRNILRHVSIPGIVPLVGGDNLGDLIDALLETTMASLKPLFDKAAYGLGHMFWALSVGWWHILAKQVDATHDAKRTGVQAQTSANNNLVTANNYTDSVHTSTLGSIRAEAVQATNYANALYGDSISITQSYYNQAVAHADALYQDGIGVTQDYYNQAVAHTNAAAAVLNGDITAAADRVQSEAVTLFGQATATAQQAVAGVQSEVQGLAGDIAGINGQLGPLVAALPAIGVIPYLQSVLAGVAAEVTTCVEPLCDTVTPNAKQLGDAGSLLQALEGLAEAGLLGALLAAAVADPQTAGHDVVAATGWLTTIGVGLADAAGAVV